MPNISGCTKTICLIGSPVEHSLSPAMHTFSFEQLGVDCVYLAYNVEPDQLEAAVNGMKELGFLATTSPCRIRPIFRVTWMRSLQLLS